MFTERQVARVPSFGQGSGLVTALRFFAAALLTFYPAGDTCRCCRLGSLTGNMACVHRGCLVCVAMKGCRQFRLEGGRVDSVGVQAFSDPLSLPHEMVQRVVLRQNVR